MIGERRFIFLVGRQSCWYRYRALSFSFFLFLLLVGSCECGPSQLFELHEGA